MERDVYAKRCGYSIKSPLLYVFFCHFLFLTNKESSFLLLIMRFGTILWGRLVFQRHQALSVLLRRKVLQVL
ncbi:hypothetical protein BKA66DRAFT_255010 [Pyrenochaeta sp. MPI-SDFR-AT-0127]|nr:hypothetical protein BKA66DRAFT_255010 [Pyrenochaeta sp. MPI-SDFR-AT-0127]